MSALGLAALAVAQSELARGVRGGVKPYGRFRGAEIDRYMALAGLPNPSVPSMPGVPWCAAAVHWCFSEALMQQTQSLHNPPVNPCPRTPGALHMWDMSPLQWRTQIPVPGAVFVVDRGKGRGHVGFVVTASPDAKTITTCEPDTASTALSATGDAWGVHMWAPADEARGRFVGYLSF